MRAEGSRVGMTNHSNSSKDELLESIGAAMQQAKNAKGGSKATTQQLSSIAIMNRQKNSKSFNQFSNFQQHQKQMIARKVKLGGFKSGYYNSESANLNAAVGSRDPASTNYDFYRAQGNEAARQMSSTLPESIGSHNKVVSRQKQIQKNIKLIHDIQHGQAQNVYRQTDQEKADYGAQNLNQADYAQEVNLE